MMKVISSLKHGVRLNEIGRIIQNEARKGGLQGNYGSLQSRHWKVFT